MAGTFSLLYIQVVFAVKGRDNLIGKSYKYDFQGLFKNLNLNLRKNMYSNISNYITPSGLNDKGCRFSIIIPPLRGYKTGSSFFTQAMALATANTASTALPELIAFMGNRLGQTRANQLLAKVGHLLTLEQQYTLQETYLYRSSRLGVKNQNATLSTSVASVQNGSLSPIGNAILNTDSVFSGTAAVYGLPKAPSARIFNRTRGLKQYELSNHLGNVQVTISDKKHGVVGANQVDFVAYEPEVKGATDYYPVGIKFNSFWLSSLSKTPKG